ncbi:MAG TPA: transposase [Candidatus Sulfotelmatobacter sp.]|nr:transposase [Candidatus Sulfotelmatobacter sp.]
MAAIQTETAASRMGNLDQNTAIDRNTASAQSASSGSAGPDRSAGVPPAVAGASRPRFGSVTIHDRGHLPHWEKEGGTYFVTFRLADSLPKSVLERIESERQAIVRTANQLHRGLSLDERRKIQQLSTPIIEQYLDSGAGACRLSEPCVAKEIASALRHFHEKRYRLFAWCIMPNHVHVVFKIFPGHTLAEIVHSWKSFTAKSLNGIVGLRGRFWQREYYDHLIRDEAELERAMGYVAGNPEKAKLKDWKWVWQCGQDADTTAAGMAALPNQSEP